MKLAGTSHAPHWPEESRRPLAVLVGPFIKMDLFFWALMPHLDFCGVRAIFLYGAWRSRSSGKVVRINLFGDQLSKPNVSSLCLRTRTGYDSGELRLLYFGIGRKATHRIVFTIEKQAVFVLAVLHQRQQDYGT